MTDRQRQARELRDAGLTYAEVGARMGVSGSAAYYLCNPERRYWRKHQQKTVTLGEHWVRHTMHAIEWLEAKSVNVETQLEADHLYWPDDTPPGEVLRVVRAG